MSDEYVCLIGGTSNTFNGYMYEDSRGVLRPSPKPKTTNPVEITRYLLGPLDANNRTPQYPFGTPKFKVYTHDRYWGNFILAALRLYMLKIVSAQPGDIITFLIYLPPYVSRDCEDWEASPHNPFNRNSPWVRALRAKQKLTPEQEHMRKALYEAVCKSAPHMCRNTKRTFPPPRKKKPTKPVYAKGMNAINHDILMRTTAPNKDTDPYLYKKRPSSWQQYIKILYFFLPEYLIWGFDQLGVAYAKRRSINKHVIAKLLFFSKWSEAKRYLLTGKWQGRIQRIATSVDCISERSDEYWTDEHQKLRLLFWNMGYYPETNWTYRSDFVKKTDVSIYKRLYRNVYRKMPSVDRRLVKIVRFDYFGHSDELALLLDYGWNNYRGELPDARWEVSVDEFTRIWKKIFESKYIHENAVSKLWGCHMAGSSLPNKLKSFFKEVIASDKAIDYEKILDKDTNMPTPVSGRWLTF